MTEHVEPVGAPRRQRHHSTATWALLTAAELYWFAWAFEGADVEHPDFGMELSEGDSADSLLATYRSAVERPNEIIERCEDLRHPCARVAGKAAGVRSMRWVPST